MNSNYFLAKIPNIESTRYRTKEEILNFKHEILKNDYLVPGEKEKN